MTVTMIKKKIIGLNGAYRAYRAYGRFLFCLLLSLLPLAAAAQSEGEDRIMIGGNVYGGGNHGPVRGTSKVTVYKGDLNSVFGGARMANVGGNAFVHIDGEHATGDITITNVYGGNDIAGTIGSARAVEQAMPTELTDVIPTEEAREEVTPAERKPYMNVVNDTWTTYVRTSRSSEVVDGNTVEKWPVVIGSLYGGGNGDFTYVDDSGNPLTDGAGNYIVKEGDEIVGSSATPLTIPNIAKTYLELKGGCIGHVYGGGNNATVTESTTLNIANESSDLLELAKLYVSHHPEYDTDEKKAAAVRSVLGYYQDRVKLNPFQSKLGSFAYNFARIYGGNNRAEMAIRPTWNVQQGKIRDIYSGGNRGSMTSPEGLLLELKPVVGDKLWVDNVYGGCRMADVKPTLAGVYTPVTNLPGYTFPNELSARVLVHGGHITNVYGGNDITGNVYGGNAIGIYTNIEGNVYGGGNGAYAYTDNEELKDDGLCNDFYYSTDGFASSIDALNAYRPNAEQVSIHLKGTDANHPTIIKGAVYIGGNSASLESKKSEPMVELKIGSHVIADKVFLGNNGEEMTSSDILKLYAKMVDSEGNVVDVEGSDYSSLNLRDQSVFADYMEGVTMKLLPNIVFDSQSNGDRETYVHNSSYVGSFFCGGNVGSMAIPGKEVFTIGQPLNIYSKFVGGCNNADVAAGTYNAAYEGGLLGSKDERVSYTDGDGNIKDRLQINLDNLNIVPKRWNAEGTALVWNTYKWGDVDPYYEAVEEGTILSEGFTYYTSDSGAGEFTALGTEEADGTNYFVKQTKGFVKDEAVGIDHDRRLLGGNIYGGCYNSGHVNGNVVININEDVIRKEEIFGAAKSTVELEDQRDDLNTVAMSVFGAGYGEETEIWGSTTVNHNNGYAFQIYGGGEQGVVGKPRDVIDEHGIVTVREYYFNPAFSSTVNLNGASPIYSSDDTADDLAETEYIYGGGNEGDVCGNTYVNLGNGRIYDAFGGSSDADIYGHTEVIIGRQPNGSGGYKLGFPWIRDIVYGGNDFGGTIYGAYEDGFDATTRIRDYETNKEQMHGYAEGKHDYLLKSSAYVEYLQGRVDSIYGGSYGYYDYNHRPDLYGIGNSMPRQESAFVNLRPESNDRNSIAGVFGAGTGYPANREDDQAQDRSYILVDLTHDKNGGFKNVEIFGAGSYNGVGMRQEKEITFAPSYDRDKVSAIIDLLHGEIGNVYGGSYREGVTCRTVVNVPEESTIKVKNIFGGAYGLLILPPCDVIQTIVNYRNTSEQAVVTGAVYGGNNNQRRAIFTNVSISSPIWSDKSKGYLAKVYGAGKGFNSWSEHTHVEMLSGAKVYEVYGGGEMGHVLNAETAQQYMQNNKAKPSVNIAEEAPWNDAARWDGGVGTGTVKDAYQEEWKTAWKDAWSLGHYYTPNATFDNYFETFAGLRSTSLVRKAEIDERDYSAFSEAEKNKRQYIYSTNVIINEGAEVVNYAYGGGLGSSATPFSGDVWGHTYIALLGGKVTKDIYAGGTAGAVNDAFARVGAYYYNTKDPDDTKNNPYGFTASATAYVKGGSCRNVYGGGWEGNVGYHYGGISDPVTGPTNETSDDDIPGNTYVVIGDLDGSSFTSGIPTIQRNAYGGGEGGAVYGTAHVKLNKGYIGYDYKGGAYVEKIEDDTKTTPNKLLEDAGCLFGGGYIDNSTVDKTHVTLNGGVVRNSVFGGGEVAAIGRGDMKAKSGGSGYELKGMYRPGKTLVDMFKGHVQRNVYGGGRGFDNLGRVGSLNSPGFVFGQTEVHIHGGVIGTEAGLAKGDGNVFGGGDIGHVYSAYENSDGTFGKGVKDGDRYDGGREGYYYKHAWADDGAYTLKDGEREYTEDCKVVVEPMCQVKLPVEIDGTGYAPGDFVPTAKLNTLGNKNSDSKWAYLDDAGIIIHNAVFAGGNNPSGAMATSANTASVFGNATASIHDVFHRDLITLGTGHTGGLYGDGNLTLVDGYRELNITNYGTDYYSIAKEITIDQYHALPAREAAYYELKYTCLQTCVDKDGTRYNPKDPENANSKASTITADDFFTLFKDVTGMIVVDDKPESPNYGKNIPNPAYWKESGVLPVYAGRLMNSIQRADFCGVFGSRMVMQGAQDRVPEEVDYTNYTINRVREVSLNKKESIAGDAVVHGNYFGIYNIVNYLGALTSDVDFGDDTSGDVRTTDNTDAATYQADANGKHYGTATFYDWKKEFHLQRKRNNGNSHNKVALASGVYLEITTEKSTGTGLYEKDWGPITGVVELDLINVAPGIGGGFVYAQNIHGKRKLSGKKNTILTGLNTGAITQKKFQYDDTSSEDYYTHDTTDGHYKTQWQSSGNFVHSTQTIIDDCYNVSNRYLTGYKGEKGVPAHYWYIKGTTYVYDQYISAYTGSSNAYSEAVDIPLTIASASHGKMKLLNVMPNRYAYYSAPGVKLESGKKMVINDNTYYANDPISYWDWYLLSTSERELFVEKTYTNCVSVSIDGGTLHEPGTLVMTDTEYNSYGTHTYTDAEGHTILDADKEIAGKDYIFRESNNASHDTGYLLTYEVNNPSKWDTWYTPKNTSYTGKIDKAEYDDLTSGQSDYEDGPTYRLKDGIAGGTVLGQQTYAEGDLIPQNVETTYQAITNKPAASTQATFQPAYLVTSKITVTEGGVDHNYYPGTAVSQTFALAHSGSVAEAYICTKTVQLSKDNLILKDSKMPQSEWQTLYDKYNKVGATEAEKKIAADLLAHVVPAYYCTVPGLYGGNYYVAGKNYRGLEAWSSMSEGDREKFDFNYDALDLLIDPRYSKDENNVMIHPEGQKYQYDSAAGDLAGAEANKATYSLETAVDYTATYNGGTGDITETEGDKKDLNYMATSAIAGGKVYVGDELSREQFESLPNEQRHYAPIAVTDPGKYYVVKNAFQIGATPYAVGSTISAETYTSLPNKEDVTVLTIDDAHKNQTYYYCREDYTGTGSVTAISSTDIDGAGGGVSGGNVQKGTLIIKTQYDLLPNEQRNFTIHGVSPTETSTLYVSRESDIYDLSKEKIITVIYQYDYEETDGTGNITPVSERHVLNIHLQFKSGVPIVEDIEKPDLILPGWFNTMREPEVTPGAYEVTGGGWELFETKSDAERHSNGIEYAPATDPLYWYQDGHYVAYYAKTYLGRTYSNAVPVSVANYHDMKAVMDAKEHHYYIDIPEAHKQRDPKIYINDYSASGANGLDLFKQLYDLSVLTGYTTDPKTGLINAGDFIGHKPIDEQVKGGDNLEFFLRADIDHGPTTEPNPAYDPENPESPATIIVEHPWTPIASGSAPCFSGTFHGDGHTISGLAPATGTTGSLFHNLCGSVYNLGVMGSFTGAGIADEGDGYVESCWVKTSAATTTLSPKPYPVFGAPSRNEDCYQVVNSYYYTGNKDIYTTMSGDAEITYSEGSKGSVTSKTDKAFYNGELAYDLNNFYLFKRYNDNAKPSGSLSYKYYKPDQVDLETGKLVPQNGSYISHNDLCSSGFNGLQYVEDRFADGDFRYAAGEIPNTEDERFYSWIVDKGTPQEKELSSFYPIYPDDYIFFGQKLTYGWGAEAHQNVPTAVAREDGRLSLGDDANRVYRAPAYFRSKDMSVYHFNPTAYLAFKSNDGTKNVTETSMTAIDFAGHEQGHSQSSYKLGLDLTDNWFYSPLLDDDGLLSIKNCDETQNLLVYAPATSGDGYVNATTHGVLTSYFTDPAYDDHYDYHGGYRLVSENTDNIYGHLVQSDLTATNDHLLVDKQDFNAPLAYHFDASHLMWYQRKPSLKEYVDLENGWQGISLPFTAELVTTDTKGEITHFYSGSETSKNGTDTKIGHEYWLRELTNNSDMTEKSAGVLKAKFDYPAAAGDAKEVPNTFLWDYYYQNSGIHNRKDANDDTYQRYYSTSRNYAAYPLLTAGTPYILGLPGELYYEFDLSGNFEALNTAAAIPKLSKQIITFASNKGIGIGISDTEMDDGAVTAKYSSTDYAFKPSYMNQEFSAGTNSFVMNADGDSFDKVPASGDATTVAAFRPYFVVPSASTKGIFTRSIAFTSGTGEEFNEGPESALDGSLEIFVRGRHIVTRSHMAEPTTVRILNIGGVTVANFVLQAGQTIETPVQAHGAYIVNKKKVFVK